MANAIYPKYKEALLSGANNISLVAETVKVSLIDNAEIAYDANTEFYSEFNANGVVATATITNTTVTNGLFDGDDITFSSVTGDESEAIMIWIDTGDVNTSRIVAYLDTGISGLPVTPNGSDIDIEWNVNGIFQL
jgi:hypothetical protein